MDKMKELYEKVAKDASLQAKLNGILKNTEQAGEAATGEKLAAFAKEAGYAVSFDEAQEFFKALSQKNERALSDAELDMVAGGKDGDDIANSVLSIGIGC
jgi:hypothetical protein